MPATAQAHEALQLANRVRLENSLTAKALATMRYAEGCETAATVLRGPMTGAIGALRAHRLLFSIRNMSDVRASRVLMSAHVFDAARPLRRLSARQREAMAAELLVMAAGSRRRR